jgi:hypothetical protein
LAEEGGLGNNKMVGWFDGAMMMDADFGELIGPGYGSRDHITIYTINSEPLIIQHFDGPFVPTLHVLHKCQYGWNGRDHQHVRWTRLDVSINQPHRSINITSRPGRSRSYQVPSCCMCSLVVGAPPPGLLTSWTSFREQT